MQWVKSCGQFVVGMVVLIIVWQGIVWIGHYEEALLPSPLTVWGAIQTMVVDGTLFEHLQVSIGRFAAGYFAAVFFAIGLGMLLGRWTYVWTVVDPMVQVLRPVSPVAWSPFIVLWFGIGSMPAIAIIFIAAFFPVLLTTVAGVRNIDLHYLRIAENMEIRGLDLFIKIIFPAVFPSIVSGLHLALGSAWIFLVAGEMVGAQSGLGFLIVDARNTLKLDYVLAGIVCIGLCGFLLDRLISLFERWVGRYFGTI